MARLVNRPYGEDTRKPFTPAKVENPVLPKSMSRRSAPMRPSPVAEGRLRGPQAGEVISHFAALSLKRRK
jgi:hypothetical protein